MTMGDYACSSNKSHLLMLFATSFRKLLAVAVSMGVRDIRDEKGLKVQVIEERAKAVWRKLPGLDLITPPWKTTMTDLKKVCRIHLGKGKGKKVLVEIGCEECWAESKGWASV